MFPLSSSKQPPCIGGAAKEKLALNKVNNEITNDFLIIFIIYLLYHNQLLIINTRASPGVFGQ
ncbi:MAG: hypothetical protein AAB847_01855 [Patescibacteria group bacterium]